MKKYQWMTVVAGWLWWSGSAMAVTPITSIQAYYDSLTDTNSNFSSPGAGSAGFPTGTTYRSTFTDGPFDNLIITAFDVGTNNFIFRQLAQRINIVRVDNATITGTHHIVMFDRETAISGTNISLSSQFEGNMETILLSEVINRGADNVFCNTGDGNGNNNNIERIDYIFADGYPAFGDLTKRGFMLMDRGGNDACRVAAILSLDTNGIPATFSKSVLLTHTNWGASGITLGTVVYRGYGSSRRPSAEVSTQPLSGQYMEWTEFDIATNSLVFGYSIVAADVPTNANWANPASFPLNTSSDGVSGGGLDLMSGGALVLDEAQNAVLGNRVWNDVNQNGLQDPDERGVTNVLVQAFDNTGTNLAGQARTDADGYYNIFALIPGTYRIQVLLPTNWVFTTPDVGPDDSVDSDVNTNTGVSSFFYLPSSITNNNWDAGMYLPPTDLGVTKTVNSANPRVGTSVVFTITLTNLGPFTASSVEVADLLPAGLSFSNYGASAGAYDATTGIWSVGTVTNTARPTLVITTLVDQASAGLTLTNSTFISFSDRPDTNTANNTASVVVVLQSVDLGVSKIVSTNLIGVTNFISYRVSITNYGPDTALSVVVTDALPAGLTFSNATASTGSYSTNTSLWTIGDLLAGASATLTITARVDATSGGLTLTNTARVITAGQGDTNAANDVASVLLSVVGADLGVTKTVDNAAPYPGSNVVYTIILTNNGPSDATGVSLTERLTNGLTYVSHSASAGVYNNVSGVWTVGTLLANASASLSITASVATNTINSLLTNITTITTSDLADGNLLNNTGTAVIAVSSLRISKTSSGTPGLLPGSNLTYTIIVTNAGSLVHDNVTITDPLPTGVTYLANSARASGPITITNFVLDRFETAAFNNQNGTVNWAENWTEIGEGDGAAAGDVRGIADGTNNVLRIQDNDNGGEGVSRLVNLGGVSQATLSFHFRKSALDADTDYVALSVSSNGGTAYTEIDRFAGPNNNATYQFTNYNISAYIATNTRIRLLSSSTMGTDDIVFFDNVRVEWPVNTTTNIAGGAPPDLTSGWTLRAGEFVTVTYTTRVDNPLAVTQIVNTAEATSLSQILPISASVTDTVVAAELALTKSVNNPVSASGSNVVYTITVTNNGPSAAANVLVSEPLTNGLTFVSYGSSAGIYNSAGGVWTVGTVNASSAASLWITAQVSSASQYLGATLTNVSRISASGAADPVAGNNSATATVTVTAADLAVSKSASTLTPIPGETVVFTLGVTNIGPSAATNITLLDILPGPLSYVSSTPSQGTYTPASGIWTVGTLNVGGYASLSLSATVTGATTGVAYTNQVSVSGSSQVDPVTGNNTALVVLVTRSTDPVVITKTSSANGSAPPSFTNVYTITVSNSTTFTHTGVRVEDAVPTGMTYLASSTLITYPTNFTRTWLDNFSQRNYNANQGNTNFLSPWDESEATESAIAGNIQIAYDPVRGETYCLQFQGSSTANQFIQRNANLNSFSNATLSFEYRRDSLEAGDFVLAQISSNGLSGPWNTLLRMEGAATDADYIYTNFSLNTYLRTNVGFRFITTNTAMGSGDYVWIDNFRIDANRKEYLTSQGGLPPVAASNLTLEAGDYLTVTLQAVVDNPSVLTQVVNTASVTTDQQLVTLYASVTDRVEFADLGVGKLVSDPLPDQGGTQSFTILLTNGGPYQASEIQIQDLLPAGVTYTDYSASSGTYNPGSGIWSVDSLAVSNVASLTIQTTVNGGTAGTTITNTVTVFSARQGDRDPTNNTASASFRVVPPFIITDCDIETTNGMVKVYHEIINDQQLYDLLYVDATSFGNNTPSQWQLADRRAGGLLMDTGAVSRIAPTNLAAGTLRFYRISAPTYWETAPRRAGVQVLAFGVAYLSPGQNWVRPWGEACDNTLGEVLEHHLPAGDTMLDATRVMWFARAAHPTPCTSEVFLASGDPPTWTMAWPTNREGEVADNQILPTADGFVVQLPTNLPAQRLPMIYHVPTNAQVQVVPANNHYTMASVNLPETLHPSQLNLVAAGFTGGINPVFSDWIWKFNRTGQSVPDVIWYKTSDQTWRFTSPTTYPVVPANYFRPDDAIVIQTRKSTTDLIWTNRFNYSVPTREMTP